jgi:hypothetical protein
MGDLEQGFYSICGLVFSIVDGHKNSIYLEGKGKDQ